MVIQLLGNSIEEMFSQCKKIFTVQCVLLLAEQMLLRLEYLHSKNFIHRDIKPENFCVGKEDTDIIYLIDYGLATKFRDDKTGDHIKMDKKKYLTGTARYASLNAHNGFDQSRRDDLEGLAYVLVYLLKGVLPWQGMPGDNKKEKYRLISEKKKALKSSELCTGLPIEFTNYLEYVKKLKFDEKPDYNYLRKSFRDLFTRCCYRSLFDWNNFKTASKKYEKAQGKEDTIKMKPAFREKHIPIPMIVIAETGKEKSSNEQHGKGIVDGSVMTRKDNWLPKRNRKLIEFVGKKHNENDMDIPDETDGRITAPIISTYIQESTMHHL